MLLSLCSVAEVVTVTAVTALLRAKATNKQQQSRVLDRLWRHVQSVTWIWPRHSVLSTASERGRTGGPWGFGGGPEGTLLPSVSPPDYSTTCFVTVVARIEDPIAKRDFSIIEKGRIRYGV